MPVGDTLALLSFGMWTNVVGGECDYPDESEVLAGVEYGSGAYTGQALGVEHYVRVLVNETVSVEAS